MPKYKLYLPFGAYVFETPLALHLAQKDYDKMLKEKFQIKYKDNKQ